MAVSLIGISPLLMTLLLGGGGGLPLALPPLPEDPVLSRVAPPECLVYLNWSGTATPDPKSKNQTEQLLAEPEVQDMLRQIESAVLAGVEKNGQSQRAVVVKDAIRWGKKFLTRPVAAFVSTVEIGPNGPDVRGGLVVNAGDDVAELKTVLEKYQAFLPSPAEKVEIGGLSCYRLKLEQGAPAIAWGIKDKYLVVGIGEGSLEGILGRFNGDSPEWLTALHKQLPVERVSTVTYINVKKLIQQFAPLGGTKLPFLIEASGLRNVSTLAAVSGLDGEGMVNRTFIGIDGEPTGLFSLATGKPLQLEDLAPIPADADIAFAGRLDLARGMDAAVDIVKNKKDEPQAAAVVDQFFKNFKDRLDVDLRKDVVDSLGDVWCVYNSSNEGGLIISGLTAVVQVKDHDRLSAAHDKLLARFKAALEQGGGPQGRPPRIEHVRFKEHDIYFLSANDFPFAPSWCLTRKELIVAPFPQQIKAYLSRGDDFKSLATVPAVVEAFQGGEGPVGFSYYEGRRLLDHLYPLACAGVQMLSRELAREGIDLNVSIVPSAPTIYKHLRPGTSVMRRTTAGIEFTSRGTMPSAGLGAILPIGLFVGLHRI